MKSMFASGCSFLAAAAMTFAAATAHAEPHTHDGFYLNLHAGFGYLSVSSDTPGGDITYKGLTLPSGIALGGSIVPGLVIGGTLFSHYAPSPGASTPAGSFALEDVSMYLFGIGPFVEFYPNPNEGLHFHGSVAYGGLETSYKGRVGGSDPTGVILSVGAGYEFWVGNEWSIGPMARFTYAPLSLEDVSFPAIAPSLLATFTYH